jgi:hypothetical protein
MTDHDTAGDGRIATDDEDTGAEPNGSIDVTDDSDDGQESSGATFERFSRRGVLGGLAALGLLGAATEPASAQSTTLEFGGNYTGDPGANFGLSLNPSNARFGLLGFSQMSDGRGIVGRATSSTGQTIGVIGRADSSTDGAAGLMGFCDAPTGVTYGFRGRSDSVNGTGALGIATASSGNTIGLEGRVNSPDGVAILGNSTATSGTTYGVQGQVASPNGYGLYTPDDAKVDGNMATVDEWWFTVDGQRILLLEPGDADGNHAGNVIGGHYVNDTYAGVRGAAIAGGGTEDELAYLPNQVSGDYGAIGGGWDNTADTHAVVSGGSGNTASGDRSVVSGGEGNIASGEEATVGGGSGNQATAQWSTVGGGVNNQATATRATVGGGDLNFAKGSYSTISGGFDNETNAPLTFAAGRGARANHAGSFVWTDGLGQRFPSNGENTWSARCRGGARFVTAVDANGNPTAGVQVASGGGSWSSLSARAAKANVDPVDPGEVLEGVRSLEIGTWNYRSQDALTRHMGPMAGAFHDTFGLGADKDRIATVDADGVSLAAIQGLAERNETQTERVDQLETEVDALCKDLAERDARIDALETENEALRDRLAVIESHLNIEASGADPIDD